MSHRFIKCLEDLTNTLETFRKIISDMDATPCNEIHISKPATICIKSKIIPDTMSRLYLCKGDKITIRI